MSSVTRTGDGQAGRLNTPIDASPIRRALDWVRQHRAPGGGILLHHRTEDASQEVSGYLIPTLMNAGERELALELALWEASVQGSDGSWAAPDGIPYTFDTAQVIRGFLSVLDVLPQLEPNLRRACDYVVKKIARDGRVTSKSLEMWKLPDGSILTDYCNLYVLPPLFEAARRLNEPRYQEAATRSLEYFKQKPHLVMPMARSRNGDLCRWPWCPFIVRARARAFLNDTDVAGPFTRCTRTARWSSISAEALPTGGMK